MNTFVKTVKNWVGKYIQDRSGVTAAAFGIALPALVAAGGLAVDLGQAYNIQNRLGNAVDKAALAVAGSTGDEAELEDRMEAFMDANYPEHKIGSAYDVTLDLTGNVVTISANASVSTKFMTIFGKDYVDVSAFTEVTRELSGLEVALVLDVTGSMAGSNIAALKTASLDFMEIMFDRIDDPEYLKIGLVPYSSSINVGPYGLGLDLSGGNYGTPFVTPPDTDDFYSDPTDLVYNPSVYRQWHGCVLTQDYPGDTEDVSSSPWEMYRYPRYCRRYRYGSCTSWYENPNYNCPDTPVVPLTNNRTQLDSTINALSAQGYTYGNLGMVWGGRLVSPEEPFTEGADWDDVRWRKAILMMTDGNNTMHYRYSAYGLTDDHNITPTDLNERFEETCENIKAQGVQIYTVTFQSGINENTKGFYRRCASDESKYFHAPSNSELVSVFQEIANQLSKLHISK